MMSHIFLIGDSHLQHCYNVALKADSNASFGYSNLKVIWETDIPQLGLLEKKYKADISKNGAPKAIFLMCGAYDLMITNEPKSVAAKLKTIVKHINSTNVQFIVVCSILDRKCSSLKEEETVNRGVRTLNKDIARAFKQMSKVLFVNIRPPGKLADILDTDKYHLKDEWYNHVYKRLLATLDERIVTQTPKSKPATTLKEVKTHEKKELECLSLKTEAPIDQRLSGFKDVLRQDYQRAARQEADINTKFHKLKRQLEELSREKAEVAGVYKRLFGVDLTEEPMPQDQ